MKTFGGKSRPISNPAAAIALSAMESGYTPTSSEKRWIGGDCVTIALNGREMTTPGPGSQALETSWHCLRACGRAPSRRGVAAANSKGGRNRHGSLRLAFRGTRITAMKSRSLRAARFAAICAVARSINRGQDPFAASATSLSAPDTQFALHRKSRAIVRGQKNTASGGL
jgi:hypothetical protein